MAEFTTSPSMKQLLFVSLRYDPNALYYPVVLPPQRYEYKSIKELRLLQWAVEGITFTTSNTSITGPLYLQLQIQGDLECATMNNLGVSGMVQVPVESLGGFPAGQLGGLGIQLPVRRQEQQTGRFTVGVYGPGSSPSLLVFSELDLWFQIVYSAPAGSMQEFSL
jgi:hypothetical protein